MWKKLARLYTYLFPNLFACYIYFSSKENQMKTNERKLKRKLVPNFKELVDNQKENQKLCFMY